MKKGLQITLGVVVTVAVSVLTTLVVMKASTQNQNQAQSVVYVGSDSLPMPVSYARIQDLPKAGETDFTVAAELSVNAVVHVKTTYKAQAGGLTDPLLEFFFGRPQQILPRPEQQASGSGVIISQDGYIVTNNHVIDKAKKIEVVLNDKREFEATLVGADPNTDIALLKIEATNLPVMTIGNSDDLKVGEWVLAVGNPFNLTSTVTAGIVSAKARNINIISSEMKIESFIQTDAAVNPGNSGGALVNTRGELVGINTAIASQTGSYTGYSFAVPSSIMEKVVTDIRQFGTVQRAILGVQIQEITNDLKKEKELTTLQGAYVVSVVNDGAADKAGVKAGDVITHIDGVALNTATDLQEQIGRHSPGDKVELTIIRSDKTITLTAELTNRNGGTTVVDKVDNFSALGVEFKEVDEATAQKLNLSYGIQVKSTTTNGKFSKNGIKKDMIVLKANNRTIRTENDFLEVYQSALEAPERERALFITACDKSGKVQHFAIDLE